MSPAPGAQFVDSLMEATVVPSFSRVGYHARRRLFEWTPLSSLRLDGKTAIVTGATGGLGRWAAEAMARQGARVCLVGRDRARTERARTEIASATGAEVEAELADLSSLAETAALADRFASSHDRLDVLLLNAGLLTHGYTETAEGNELTLATHVLSQFLLTSALRPLLEASAPARVVSVSSGGMYAVPLDVDALVPDAASYDGTKQYARCKRAQVVLSEEWTRNLLGTGVVVNAMHPGWADTPGIPHRAARLQPAGGAVPAHAGGRCGHDGLAVRGARSGRAERPLLPRPPSADEAPAAADAPPGRAARGRTPVAALSRSGRAVPPGCRFVTGSRRSASSSPTRRAGSSTGTAAASTTRTGRSGGGTTASSGSRAASGSRAGTAGR